MLLGQNNIQCRVLGRNPFADKFLGTFPQNEILLYRVLLLGCGTIERDANSHLTPGHIVLKASGHAV